MAKLSLFGVSALLALGCARGPNVGSDLPLRRVVVYRNGVGYFERAGEVDGETVTFKMRPEAVGDFLATLAIVERGGSSVRSASFPIDVNEPDAPPEPPEPPEPPRPLGLLRPDPQPKPKPPERDERLRDVVLHLDGKKHYLSIGYVAETPVWRPSYRLVVGKSDKASLQTWGIVQNLSGEDWNDVELVLVAGAPIAFQSQLGQPVIPPRPVITDSGEVIAAVPGGVTTLAEAAEPMREALAEEEPAEDADMEYDEGAAEAKPSPRRSMAKKLSRAPAGQAQAGYGGEAAPKASPPPAPISAPRNLSALAAVAMEGGTTRYQIPSKVTVPDESATMVLLLNQEIPGGAVFLFAPDYAVPDSASHPFRVARFTNTTSGLLERGPIAVFEKGSFLGEGMLDPLPPKATATVPFALERGLAVQSSQKYDELGARLHKIEAGQLTIQRDSVRQTVYEVTNGTADPARLLVKHPRLGGSRLHDPPKGTEDNVGTGTALVPVDIAGHGKAKLVVDERTDRPQGVDWLSPLADTAIQAFLKEPGIDPALVSALRAAWEIRQKLVHARDETSRLSSEQNELEKAARETRLSLKAIEKNPQAADLRRKLTKRLDDVGHRMDEITKRLVEVKMATEEQGVRFRDAVRELRYVRPAEKTP